MRSISLRLSIGKIFSCVYRFNDTVEAIVEKTFENFDAKWQFIEGDKSGRISCRLKADHATVKTIRITFGADNRLPIDTDRLSLAVKGREKQCK